MNQINWNRQDFIYIAVVFLICLAIAITQQVNPFVIDGWFYTKSFLVRTLVEKDHFMNKLTGLDNYTPIGFPALIYKITELVALVFNLDLKQEFYLGAIANNILIFLSILFTYTTLKILTNRIIALVGATTILFFVQSTFVTQSFWSETSSIFLITLIIYLTVSIIHDLQFKNSLRFTQLIILGLSLGVFIITRAIPIILIPIIIWIFYQQKHPYFQFKQYSSILLTCFLVILLAMSANYYRFGRFELSNSMGRHLWNSVTDKANFYLQENDTYKLLEQYSKKDVQGLRWWDVEIPNISEFEKLGSHLRLRKENILKKLSVAAIRKHPLEWIKDGIHKFLISISTPVPQIGFFPSPVNVEVPPQKILELMEKLTRENQFMTVNPLYTKEYLPPILSVGFNSIIRFTLQVSYYFYELIYGLLSWLVILLSLYIISLARLTNDFENRLCQPKIFVFSCFYLPACSSFMNYTLNINSYITQTQQNIIRLALLVFLSLVSILYFSRKYRYELAKRLKLSWQYILAFLYIFLVYQYLSVQVEEFSNRFAFPLLPVLIMNFALLIYVIIPNQIRKFY